MSSIAIADTQPWEVADWLPDGDDLPGWLDDCRKRHADAVAEYTKAVAYTVDTEARIEADNRAHRRAVRDAVMAGKEPPTREASEVGEATVEVAAEDSEYARMELAATSCEILNEVRAHLHELDYDHFMRGSSEFRFALARGPQGGDERTEDERLRIERQANEPDGIVDITDPSIDTTLGEQEATNVAAA